jgi:hypothetical protein
MLRRDFLKFLGLGAVAVPLLGHEAIVPDLLPAPMSEEDRFIELIRARIKAAEETMILNFEKDIFGVYEYKMNEATSPIYINSEVYGITKYGTTRRIPL